MDELCHRQLSFTSCYTHITSLMIERQKVNATRLQLDVLKSPGNDRTVATVQLASGRLIRGKASYSIVHLRLACAERNRLVCSHLIDSRVSGFRLVEHVARMTTYLE